MSGSNVASRKSYKSYHGDEKKTGGYAGDEELKEFTHNRSGECNRKVPQG